MNQRMPGQHVLTSLRPDVDALPLPAATVDVDGTLTAMNSNLTELVGHDHVGRPATDLAHGSSRDRLGSLLTAGNGSVELLLDGSPVQHAAVHFQRVERGDGVLIAVPLGSAGPGMFANHAHDLLGQGVVIGDGQRIQHVNGAAAKLFGRPAGELIEMGSLFGLFERSEQERLSDLVALCEAEDRPLPEHHHTVIVRPDGSRLDVELSIKATVVSGETTTYTLISDATERLRDRRDIAYKATHDELTGLANRYLLFDRVERALARLSRRGGTAGLCFVDLDQFKSVNDDYGHAAGDVVLRTVAERIVGALRPDDTAARIGGDEFVILIEELPADTEPERALELLEQRLCAAIEEPIDIVAARLAVAASMGSVCFGSNEQDIDALIATADRAMFDVKRRRRAGVSTRSDCSVDG